MGRAGRMHMRTVKTLALAVALLVAAITYAASEDRLLPTDDRLLVPSPVSISGDGGGLGRRPSVAAKPRFFFAGNGRLVLRHGHFDTTLDVRYRHRDGTYDPAALAQINHFFRSREDGREAAIALRLIELLAYVQDHYHPRQMTVLSGFRSPEFNTDLRAAGGAVAQASLHTEGLAADIAFSGLDMQRLWRRLRAQRTGGAGYYRTGKFLHLDTGPARFWEETTSRVSENLAAGNARLFVRTDFDRYARIEGTVCSLHSVTALPLRVSYQATLVGPDGRSPLTLEPVTSGVELREGCLAITAPTVAYRLRVATAGKPVARGDAPPDSHSVIVLSTCEPRIEKTPPEVASNPIEITSP